MEEWKKVSLKLTQEVDVADKDLIEAIAIRYSECFGALNIVNAISGHESCAWQLIRSFSGLQLLEEARERGICVENIPQAVNTVVGTKVSASPLFKAKLAKKEQP